MATSIQLHVKKAYSLTAYREFQPKENWDLMTSQSFNVRPFTDPTDPWICSVVTINPATSVREEWFVQQSVDAINDLANTADA